MLLENRYYQMTGMQPLEDGAVFHIRLLPHCDVYRGHFPGHPVCPGALNIQTIKECAVRLSGRPLHLSGIKQCRLIAVATPDACPQMDVSIRLQPCDGGYTVTARMSREEQVYVEFKGEMKYDGALH